MTSPQNQALFIQMQTLDWAQRDLLLHEHDAKIEAVAAISGFNSVRTFYRLFQKTYLLTPSEFRNVAILNKQGDLNFQESACVTSALQGCRVPSEPGP